MADSTTLNRFHSVHSTKTNRDGEGPIVRHFVRPATVPEVIATGLAKELFWPDVYQSLIRSVKHDLPQKMDIVDSVSLDRMEVKGYCYADVFGFMLEKSIKTLEEVHSAFLKVADFVQGDNAKNVALCFRYGQSKPIILDRETFHNLCFQTIFAPSYGSEIQIMQPLIPSRGYDTHYKTFRTSYWLENLAALPQMKTEVDVSYAVARSGRVKRQVNRSRRENQRMEEMVLRAVGIVERHNHCRVTKAAFDFVQDIQDKIWLVCSTECTIVLNTADPLKPMTVPAELKRARATRTAELQRQAQDEREQRAEHEQQMTSATQSQQGRWNRRPSTAAPLSVSVNVGAVRRMEKVQSLRKGGRPRSPTAYVRPEVPGATLGGGNFCDEVPDVPLVPVILGSSQMHGICPGDFCEYNVDGLNPLTAAVSSSASAAMSNFRRRIAAMEDRSSSTVLDDDEDLNGPEQQEAARRRRGSTRRGSTFRTRFIDATKAAAEAGVEMKESDPNAPNLLISFRSIVQARQEAQLVKSHLIRVAHGAAASAEYVTENNQAQLDAVAALSAKMAPVYYKEVPVCVACYTVYTVVDQARQRSLQKLASRRRELALLQKSRPQTAPHAMSMASMSASLSLSKSLRSISESQMQLPPEPQPSLLPPKRKSVGGKKKRPVPVPEAGELDVP